jgi:hypothetical protein
VKFTEPVLTGMPDYKALIYTLLPLEVLPSSTGPRSTHYSDHNARRDFWGPVQLILIFPPFYITLRVWSAPPRK